MIITPLAVHSPRAIDEALRSHGWDGGRAADAAGGIRPAAFLLSGVAAGALESLVRFGGQLGLEVVTGDGWAVVAGSHSRLSALARPWTVPEALQELAMALGMALAPEPPRRWRTARGTIALDRPVLVGILNVTPDSFSDGGAFADSGAAVARAVRLMDEGAAIIDIGGESTRPGRSGAVSEGDELARVMPVIEQVVRELPDAVLSIDTIKASVARAAMDAGAAIVNDVSGLRLDPAMAATIAASGAGAILTHSRGTNLELASYTHAAYPSGVVAEVLAELRAAIHTATSAGVGVERIVIDPGLGFSKTVPQNMTLLDQLSALTSLGRPILVGPSRKRFLSQRPDEPRDRDGVTAVACALAWERGARLFRVHDVASVRAALDVASAVGAS